MHVKSVCSFFVTFMGINYFEWDILFLVPTNVKTLPLGLLLRNILHLLKESYLHCSHFPHAQWKPRGIFLVPSVLHFFGLSKSLMLQRWILIMISSLISSSFPDKLNQTPMVFCYQNCSDLCTVTKNCSSDREKLLKFEAEGREFAKFFRSLEQFIQTVKGQNNFW